MKNLLILFLICFVYATGARSQEHFKINGQIKEAISDKYIYLSYNSKGNAIIDSVKISKGKFVFKGSVELPVIATLYRKTTESSQKRDSKRVYLHAGEIKVQTLDSLRKSKLIGSDLNQQFEELSAALSKPSKAGMKREESLAEVVGGFVKKYPNSFASLDALDQLILPLPQDANVLIPLYGMLSEKIKNSPKGSKTGEVINQLKSIAIGVSAPAFVQYDVDDKEVNLSDFHGQYVLIDFWASWCKPCRAENPVLVKAYERFKSQNFTILGITLDVNKAAWENAIKEDGLTWIQAGEVKTRKNSAADLYYIQAIPQNFLLDPSGKIIAKNIRGEELEQILEKVL